MPRGLVRSRTTGKITISISEKTNGEKLSSAESAYGSLSSKPTTDSDGTTLHSIISSIFDQELELELILADKGLEQAVQDKANELHIKFMSLAEGVLEINDAERTVKAAYEPLLSTLEHSASQVRKADTLEQQLKALGHVIECLISYYTSRLGDVGTQDDDQADEAQRMVLTHLKSQVTCLQGRQKRKKLRERYQVVMEAKRARKVCLEKLGRIKADLSKS